MKTKKEQEGVMGVSFEIYGRLYLLALEFLAIAPWKRLCEDDNFAVVNPETGETVYCCIMGNAGEFFAIMAYRGATGWNGYKKVHSGDVSGYDVEILSVQDGIIVSFEEEDTLSESEEDMLLLKKFGSATKKGFSSPLFRSHKPGFLPWFLTEEEALFMIVVLEQALDVVSRYYDDKKLLHKNAPKLLTRIPKEENGNIVWQDEWRLPERLKKKLIFTCEDFGSASLKSLFEMEKKHMGIWEVGYFYAPTSVRDGEGRPYFPYMMLVVDKDSGYVFLTEVFHNLTCEDVRNAFQKIIEKTTHLPETIHVASEEMKAVLAPFAENGDMDIEIAILREIEYAKNSMYEYFKDR